jgi:hypothetical protein
MSFSRDGPVPPAKTRNQAGYGSRDTKAQNGFVNPAIFHGSTRAFTRPPRTCTPTAASSPMGGAVGLAGIAPGTGKPSRPRDLETDFTGASGLFSIVLKPVPQKAIDALLDTVKLFGMGFSWDGFESLIAPFDCGTTVLRPNGRRAVQRCGFILGLRMSMISRPISNAALQR